MKKLFVSVVALLAAVSLSAQDVTAIYNEAAAAFGAKDFAGAAAKFEQVIEQGLDSEEAASLVATAKTTLPKCYFMMGGGAIRTKNYDEALKNFTKSAELAELYGDMSQMAKANGWVAKIYQIQGGDAFNNKDYATAAGVFEKGYKADPDNTAMALNLAMSYCEMGEYEKGMDIYEAVAAKTHPKYADDAAKAKEMIALYTNNKVATLQAANDFDGIIAMADALLAKNAENALAQKVRLQAYASKKDYNKVIELGEAAAKVQTDPEDVSLMYLTLGAAYDFGGDLNPTVTKNIYVGDLYNSTVKGDTTHLALVLPRQLSAGVFYQTSKWTMGVDYVYQDWRSGNTRLVEKSAAGFDVAYRNTNTVKLGVEYTPNKADVRSALKRWSYRAGVRYGTYNQTFGGVDVNEYAVTLGVGIPLTVLGGILGASSVDLGVEVGGRGSFKAINEQVSLVKQTYCKFSLGVTLFGDYWFVRPKYD